MPWPQLGHSCSTVARVDFRFTVCSVRPEAQAGAALAFVRVSRGSEALDSVNKHEAPQFEHCNGSRAGISRKLPQWPQKRLPPMESTTRRLSAIPCARTSSSGFCVCDLCARRRALRRSRSVCDHARQRQVLSSNRWVVVSGLSREVSRLDAGVVRRRAAVVSAPTAATEWLRRHWCRGCRSGGVLWLQVGALAVCTHAVAAMRAGKDRL